MKLNVGKTAIVEGLAQQIASMVPENHLMKVVTDLALIVCGLNTKTLRNTSKQ